MHHIYSCKAFNNKISLAWLVFEEVDRSDKEEQSFNVSKTIRSIQKHRPLFKKIFHNPTSKHTFIFLIWVYGAPVEALHQ